MQDSSENKQISIKTYLSFTLLLVSLPFFFLFKNTELKLNYIIFTLANVSGYFGLVFFIFEVLLGNRVLVKYFTPNLIEVNKFHKNLGIYGFVFVFLHPLLEMYSYAQNILFMLIPNFSSEFNAHLSYGKLAFILFIVLLTTSTWFRKKIIYRYWLYIHYLAYPITLLTFIHLVGIGTYFKTVPFVQLYVFFLGGIFISNLIYRLAIYFNYGKYLYSVKEIKEYGNDIYTITLGPENQRAEYKPGQYYYVKIDKYFGEEHPFSLLEYKNNGDLVFGIRAIGNFSKKIKNLRINSEVFIDGPYGVFTLEGQNKDHKVIIAGGVGITPFYELIKNWGNEKTYLFYCNKKLHDAINIMELKQMLNENYFNVLDDDDTKGETIINQRIDIDIIKGQVPERTYKKAKFFICGSPIFIEAITQILEKNKINKDRIFYEAFSL